MEILIILSCCAAYIILGEMIPPFHSPYPYLQDEEFTIIINAIICFIVACILILSI